VKATDLCHDALLDLLKLVLNSHLTACISVPLVHCLRLAPRSLLRVLVVLLGVMVGVLLGKMMLLLRRRRRLLLLLLRLPRLHPLPTDPWALTQS
jgi:hypothetical protein